MEIYSKYVIFRIYKPSKSKVLKGLDEGDVVELSVPFPQVGRGRYVVNVKTCNGTISKSVKELGNLFENMELVRV